MKMLLSPISVNTPYISFVFLLIVSCFSLQAGDAGKSASQHHSLLVAANQAAVISAAKSASAAAGGSLSKTAVATLVKGAGSSGIMTKSAAGSPGAVVTVAKGITNMPVVSMSKSAGVGTVVGVPKSSGTSLVTAASLVSGVAAGGGKTGATLSGTVSRDKKVFLAWFECVYELNNLIKFSLVADANCSSD